MELCDFEDLDDEEINKLWKKFSYLENAVILLNNIN